MTTTTTTAGVRIDCSPIILQHLYHKVKWNVSPFQHFKMLSMNLIQMCFYIPPLFLSFFSFFLSFLFSLWFFLSLSLLSRKPHTLLLKNRPEEYENKWLFGSSRNTNWVRQLTSGYHCCHHSFMQRFCCPYHFIKKSNFWQNSPESLTIYCIKSFGQVDKDHVQVSIFFTCCLLNLLFDKFRIYVPRYCKNKLRIKYAFDKILLSYHRYTTTNDSVYSPTLVSDFLN